MIEFILNNKTISTDTRAGATLLDFIRYQQQLKGTKIGCREGDCGACTVLMGELVHNKMHYKSLTSCITPLGNAHGKHIVTIEGLNIDGLTPYQQAMVDSSASQCGMCTVGFIVSFAGECLAYRSASYDGIVSAIDGNICRCTGYKSIERAARTIHEKLDSKTIDDPVPWLVKHAFIPEYFLDIPEQIGAISVSDSIAGGTIIGGGTDLLVQQHDEIFELDIHLLSDNKRIIGIDRIGDTIYIKSATNTTQLIESDLLQGIFPQLRDHLKLVSSTPIRNIATVAGNIVNASPIGDLTVFFLALNARVHLQNKVGNTRDVYLNEFYKSYKVLDMEADELVTAISFKVPHQDAKFNFEKVSKRRHLDIATVNSATMIHMADGIIMEAHLSAGGLGPTPLYLLKTSAFLVGKELTEENIEAALDIIPSEISPISDVRGSKDYKTLLLRQLVFAHFIVLFPNVFQMHTT